MTAPPAEEARAGPLLILGGTGEARELAAALHAGGVPVVSALAGRVPAPRLPPGETRIGGFGGPDGLAAWLEERGVAGVVDATHPFAEQISASAAIAAARTGVPLLRLDRPPWTERPGDRWIRVPSAARAAARIPALGRRVLLALGSRRVDPFAAVTGAWFLIRGISEPAPPLPALHEVLLDRGPFTRDGELELLERHRIDLVVTRDSGGTQTSAKLDAARERGTPVLMIERPPPPDVPAVDSVARAAEWARAVRGTA